VQEGAKRSCVPWLLISISSVLACDGISRYADHDRIPYRNLVFASCFDLNRDGPAKMVPCGRYGIDDRIDDRHARNKLWR